MVLKISMTKPARKPKTTQDSIKNSTINRIKRLDDISNKKMNMGISSTCKNFLNIKSRSIPSLNRPTTTSSTEESGTQGLKPVTKLTHTSRSPNTIDDREYTKRSLSKKSSNHHQSWESWQYKHPTAHQAKHQYSQPY